MGSQAPSSLDPAVAEGDLNPGPTTETHVGNEESAELDAVLAGLERSPRDGIPAAHVGRSMPRSSSRSLRARPTLALGDQHDALDRFESAAASKRSLGTWIGWGGLVLGAALVATVVSLGRERSRDLVGLRGDPVAVAPASAPAHTPRYGTLTVTSNPPRAQVLLRVGAGPALATKLAVGVVHEFVALRPGYGPARGLVATDAEWQREAGEFRYELALQLREATSAPGESELGSAQLPAALGAPTGTLGTVRVVTSPPGADVYQLVGFTPDVKVENLPIETPLQLLVYRDDHELQRITVGPGAWKAEAGGLSAAVEITLLKRGSRERK